MINFVLPEIIQGDKPVIIYVILPDETPIYEDLAGVLISQLMNHYIYIAEIFVLHIGLNIEYLRTPIMGSAVHQSTGSFYFLTGKKRTNKKRKQNKEADFNIERALVGNRVE